MADTFTKEKRSVVMSHIRAKNTSPELTVRRIVFALGFRYRLHQKDLPGKPDLVFAGRRKVIFIHGCFWHLHRCSSGRYPKSNCEYWVPKLNRNVERDKQAIKDLGDLGWQALTIWECEIADTKTVADRIKEFLNQT